MGEVNRAIFGYMPDNSPVEEITLRCGILSCGIITYGGAIRTLTVPDKFGKPVDVVLGFDTVENYMKQDGYLGALIGRYANRIGGASFTLNDVKYCLPSNDGPNHLHGGHEGFDKKIWTVEDLSSNCVTLSLFSPNGDEGYPGNLWVRVTYTLQKDGLEIEYSAKADQDTLCNLTNHSYFNLSGHGSGSVTGQFIQLMAGRYTPTASGSIPTGAIDFVEGTPMDFRTFQPIGTRIESPFDQLTMAEGYDHNWVVDDWDGQLRLAAKAWSPDTGISLAVWTTLPGVQFYSGNYLDGCPTGKSGALYEKRCGFCLESQLFPDSPNQPNFPSAMLAAGAEYCSKTVFNFGVTENPYVRGISPYAGQAGNIADINENAMGRVTITDALAM